MIREIFDGPILFMSICELACVVAFAAVKGSEWRGRPLRNILAAILVVALIRVFDFLFVDFDTPSTALEAPVCFLAAGVFAHLILKMSRREALYCSLWSYIITEIVTQIVMPLSNMIMERFEGMRRFPLTPLLYMAAVCLAVYLICYHLGPQLLRGDHYHVGRQKILMSAMIVCVYTVLANYQFVFWMVGDSSTGSANIVTGFRLVAGVGSLFFLYMQNSIEKQQWAEQERDMIRGLWERQQAQYRISQENISLINRKCHDLKYQMAALRALEDGKERDAQLRELEEAVMIYDSAIRTGNAALDTVLTEKSLHCEANQIKLVCMADASALEFMGNVDLYTIFGNALDNAMEYLMKLEETDKRIIKVTVFREKEFVVIRVKNPCEDDMTFVDGLPQTTKDGAGGKGYHGFGLKSIRYTVEKYGGQMHCQCAKGAFELQIMLPVAEK